MSGIVQATRPRQALRPDARGRRARPRRRRRARSSGWSGPNGAGKTTTLRILATLLVPDGGRRARSPAISVRRNPNDVRRVLGFMPDWFGVYDDMKVWEYLDFFARCYGIPADRRRRMIGDLLDLVDLGHKRDTYVQGLSRGMQQRLCLAHALVHDPQVLLLDEPASGLDPRARVELRELLRELRALGKTILDLVSHILPELEELCTSRRDHRPRPGARPGPGRRHRAAASRRCGLPRPGARRRDGGRGRPGVVREQPNVASAQLLEDGTDRDRVPRRRRRCGGAARRGGPRRPPGRDASPGPRATSRSCSSRSPRRNRSPRSLSREHRRAAAGRAASAALRDVGTGIAAVGVKELRGRMRGRRAFVMLTIHLLLVAGFAWMIEPSPSGSLTGGFGGISASAEIGRTLFSALIMLLTLIVLVLAPASTAGAISLEREKQTLDLLDDHADLVARDHPRQAAVGAQLGVPAAARVDPRDGAGVHLRRRAPEDLVRSYVVLFATAIAFGSMGLFVSALVKRTQAATVINLVMTIVLTAGATFIFVFWSSMTANGFLPNEAARRDDSLVATLTRRPPEVLLYFNPFVAQLDVICGTETGFGGTCRSSRR